MKKLFYLILTVVITSTYCYGQGNNIKALFIFNFTRYIEWPLAKPNFTIGVYDSEETTADFKKFLQGKKVSNSIIQVENIKSMSAALACNIVYFSEAKNDAYLGMAAQLKNKPILVITDKPGMLTKGAGINYIMVGTKQKFEISKENIEGQGLKMSSTLLNLSNQ